MSLEQLIKHFDPFDLSGKNSLSRAASREKVERQFNSRVGVKKASFIARVMSGTLTMMLMNARSN